MRRSAGFTLMELLIVVTVILVIAAIAIPNLLRAKIAGNEASAVQSVRQIATAELSYHASYPNIGYAPDLASLGGPMINCTPAPTSACVLDTVVSSGIKSGYRLFAAGFSPAGTTTNTQFVDSAAPLSFGQSGNRKFCIATDDGSMRVQLGTVGGVPAPDVPTCLGYPLMN